MLRVTTLYASSARDSARYYTRYLAQDGPEAEGTWLGRQARALGFAGTVATDNLEALLSGRDPATGTQLGTALVDRIDAKGRLILAVAGFDATFSAPKSVLVWWALTGDPGVVQAHDVAVRAALEHLERYGATTRVRVHGRRQHPDDNGLTMAVFHQGTSREDDPQLHTHAVVSQGHRARRPLDSARRPLPEEAPARHRRALPVGAARRADSPLRRRVGVDRQRSGRDRRYPTRAAGGLLQAHRAGRGPPRPASQSLPRARRPRPHPVGASGDRT